MKDLFSPEALALLESRDMGDLAKKLGIHLVALSADFAEATMPVVGNTQPLGVLHGGAHVVIAESLGSMAANVHAHPNGYAVGIELSASHHASVAQGTVRAECRAVKLGKTLATHQIQVFDDANRLLSTVRITNLIRPKSNT
jgi:uncharacterized protein (TIGR00369 family)